MFPTDDFSHVFISHVKLYSFAEQWDMPRLKSLALQKLYISLLNHTIYKVRVDDIFALIRFSYDNENIKDDEESAIDPLRRMLVDYAVCHVMDLFKHEEFVELLSDGTQFGRDLLFSVEKATNDWDELQYWDEWADVLRFMYFEVAWES